MENDDNVVEFLQLHWAISEAARSQEQRMKSRWSVVKYL